MFQTNPTCRSRDAPILVLVSIIKIMFNQAVLELVEHGVPIALDSLGNSIGFGITYPIKINIFGSI